MNSKSPSHFFLLSIHSLVLPEKLFRWAYALVVGGIAAISFFCVPTDGKENKDERKRKSKEGIEHHKTIT